MNTQEIIQAIQDIRTASDNTDQYIKSVAELSQINTQYLQKHEEAILKHSECLQLMLEKLPALALGIQQNVERELKNLQMIQAIADELIAKTAAVSGTSDEEIRKAISDRLAKADPNEIGLITV